MSGTDPRGKVVAITGAALGIGAATAAAMHAAGAKVAIGVATYCATKFGVVGFSDAVRHELKGSNVAISVVLPGMVRTELTSGFTESGLVKLLTPRRSPRGLSPGCAPDGSRSTYPGSTAGWSGSCGRSGSGWATG